MFILCNAPLMESPFFLRINDSGGIAWLNCSISTVKTVLSTVPTVLARGIVTMLKIAMKNNYIEGSRECHMKIT